MKTFANILKLCVISLVGIVLSSIFWVFVIPGVLLWIIFRDRNHRWVGDVVALAIVLILRFSSGEWQVQIGGHSFGDWFVELTLGTFSWAVGAILVAAGYNIPIYLLDGWNKIKQPKQETEQGGHGDAEEAV